MDDWEFKTVYRSLRSRLAWPTDRSWWRWKRCWLAFGVFLYLFGGYFMVPWWIEGQLVRSIDQHPDIEVARTPEVSLNPFTFVFGLEQGRIQQHGDDFVSFREISGDFELFSSIFYWRPTLDWVVVRSPSLHLRLNESGETNFNTFMRENSNDTSPGSSVGLYLNQLRIRGGRVAWNDRRSQPVADLTTSQLVLNLRSVEWPPRSPWPVDVQGQVGDTGQYRVDGEIHAGRGDAELAVSVDRIPLTVTNDYLGRYLDGRWDTGTISLDGRFVKRSQPEEFRFQSDLHFQNLRLNESGGTTVFSVDQLEADTLEMDVLNRAVRLNSININGPFIRLDARDGYRINLANMIKSNPGDSPADQSSGGINAAGWKAVAGPTRLRSGRTIVHDANVPDGFTVGYHNISGTVARVSLTDTVPASVALSAQSNRGAGLSVNGRVLARAPTEQSLLTVEYRNGPMVALSPYSSRFVGYGINKGKMRLDLDYDLLDRVIDGSNHVVLDQFELGEKVNDSPVLSVPVKLAVALLKNDEGIIDLEVPVTGNLDKPAFNFGGAIRQAVNNTISSIVSSPFRFLAGLVPGDPPDLSVVKYPPGESTPLESEQRSIEALAIALEKRPRLTLEIRPVWTTADRNHLARRRVDQILSEAGADTSALHESIVTLETVFVREQSRDQLQSIESAHTTDNPDDPGQSLDRVAYSQALYEELVRGVEVSSKQLNVIADSRAQQLLKRLTDQGIDGDRLFVMGTDNPSSTTTPVELPLSLSPRK